MCASEDDAALEYTLSSQKKKKKICEATTILYSDVSIMVLGDRGCISASATCSCLNHRHLIGGLITGVEAFHYTSVRLQ